MAAIERGGHAAKIREDRLEPPDLFTSVPLIEANDTAALGFDGKGETIAILDTGVSANHPFLAGQVIGGCANPVCQEPSTLGIGFAFACNYTPNSGLCQHGTAVAGIAAGKKITVNGTTFSGVAPGAKILSYKVASPDNNITDCIQDTTGNLLPFDCPVPRAFDIDVISALDTLDTLNPKFHFAAANYSFGSPSGAPVCLDFGYLPAVLNLMSLGIATVAAAGNEGLKNQINDPACVPGVISVGNTTKGDVVTKSSNSAPPLSPSVPSLSLLAPGNGILTSWSAPCPPTSPPSLGSGFCFIGGTSMAAPHVAGAIAVLKQHFPTLGIPTLLAALQKTGVPVTDTFNGVTTPRIRLLTAMVSLKESGFTAGFKNKLPGGRIVSEGTGLRSMIGSITITSIGPGDAVKPAFLYFMTINGSDANRTVSFNGSPVQATLIGASPDPCTGGNGSAARVYRADVTALVPGNGTYSVSGVGGTGTGEGASLVIVVSHAGAQTRQVLIQQGAMTARQGQYRSFTFPLATPSTGGQTHVGIGAGRPANSGPPPSGTEGPLKLGSATVFPSNAFFGSDGAWWDDRTAFVKTPLPASPVENITSLTDCLAWAYAGLSTAG